MIFEPSIVIINLVFVNIPRKRKIVNTPIKTQRFKKRQQIAQQQGAKQKIPPFICQ